jgi:uncharacterized protein (TIGR03437 family)
MRYRLSKLTFVILIILFAALYFARANSTTQASSVLAPPTGEAVVNHLEEQGLYSSLVETVRGARAARYDARSLPSRSAQNAEGASSPEPSLAINLPFTQLFKQAARDGAANDDYGCSVAADGDTIVVGADLDTVGNNARQGSAYVLVRSGGDWVLQQKLTANDGAAEDRFGASVAISGGAIVIGAPFDKTGTNVNQGSAYVFARSGSVWSLQQKLTANDGAANDQFGASVAISGGAVVAGAFSDDIDAKADQGSAYVFVRSSGVWSFQQKLTANDGAANDQFGASVAISGGTVIAGALLDDLGTTSNTGSAYVFVRSGTVWTQQQRLTANIARSNDLFGAAVAINGDIAIIGAPLADPFGVVNQGAAYVFARSGGVWSFQQELRANDGETEDQFGSSVAINGDTALVGAHFDDIGAGSGIALDQGSAYLFTRSGAGWTPRQKLTAHASAARELFGNAVALNGDRAFVGAPHAKVGANASQGAVYIFGCGYAEQQTLTSLFSAAGDGFGYTVAVDGDTAVIGAPGEGSGRGFAYVFARSGSGWTESATLYAADGVAGDSFGASVAISGGVIVIGAPHKDLPNSPNHGSAYFFVRSGGGWTQQNQAFGSASDDYFGWSVSIIGPTIAVGAPFDDIGSNKDQGSIYLFTRSGATLQEEGTLTASDGTAFDRFGWSVAISGDKMLVGAPGPNTGERSKGAAYVFERLSAQSPSWMQRAKLIADDGQARDNLGDTVAISGNTALVSASGKILNDPPGRQAAYVFVGPGVSGGVWSQQARLILGEGSINYSLSVAISGNTAVIGTSRESIDGRADQGTARVFTRSGAVWTPQQQIVAREGAADDRFGSAVAISGDTILVGAPYGGDSDKGTIYALKYNCGASLAPFVSVSAASFAAGGLPPESIVAGFGANLATSVQAASSTPLPTVLAGVRVKIKDSADVERLAPLFFVSPGQINYLIPEGVANGQAILTVMRDDGPAASGEVQIDNVAPGLFSADSSGQGVANATVLRVKADGSQIFESAAKFDPAQGRFVPAPIDLGPGADQVFLVFYGSGLRFRSSLSAVSCSIGGASSEALYAGVAPGFVGLDQVNVRLPRSLAGRGEVDVALIVEGKAANIVRISIR